MWRIPAVAVLVTALAAPAHADTGFWRSAGLPGVAAFGVYRTGHARATIGLDLKDTKRDHRSPAVRFVFTERHHHRAVRLARLRGKAPRHEWRRIASANTGHLYVQECLGVWHRRRFVVRRCADRHRRY
jgi:hypothetical protein